MSAEVDQNELCDRYSAPAPPARTTLASCALATCVLALTAIIPTGPGFAGSFEIAAQNLLGIFGVNAALATAWLEYSRIPTLIATLMFLVYGLAALRFASSRAKRAEPADPQPLPELRSTA